MKPTQEQVIAWAREAADFCGAKTAEELDEAYAIKFANLAYAAGAADEREACAKVCAELKVPPSFGIVETSYYEVGQIDCEEAIRARGES